MAAMPTRTWRPLIMTAFCLEDILCVVERLSGVKGEYSCIRTESQHTSPTRPSVVRLMNGRVRSILLKTRKSGGTKFQLKRILPKSTLQILCMRRVGNLCRELGYFLCPLISERTKLVIEAKNYSLPPETEFFNTIDRKSPLRNLALAGFSVCRKVWFWPIVADQEPPHQRGFLCSGNGNSLADSGLSLISHESLKMNRLRTATFFDE